MTEKCCGACKHMKNEDIYGIGVCEINNEAVYCGDGKHCLRFLKKNGSDMKAAELMIGDLVKTNKGDIIKVESISTKRQHRKVGYHTEESCTKIKYVRQGQIEPILLTPEILEANGFRESIEEGTYYFPERYEEVNIRGYAVETDETGRWMITDHQLIVFRYVHEFQRVLRCCGMWELANNFKIK